MDGDEAADANADAKHEDEGEDADEQKEDVEEEADGREFALDWAERKSSVLIGFISLN